MQLLSWLLSGLAAIGSVNSTISWTEILPPGNWPPLSPLTSAEASLLASPKASSDDLSDWIPESHAELGTVLLRGLAGLHVIHLRGLVHGSVSARSFTYADTASKVVLGSFESVSSAGLSVRGMNGDLRKIFEVVGEAAARADMALPPEIVLCQLKLNSPSHQYMYPILVRVVSRLLPVGEAGRVLNRQLTAHETFNAHLDAVAGKCIPPLFQADGSLFVVTGQVTRSDGLVAAIAIDRAGEKLALKLDLPDNVQGPAAREAAVLALLAETEGVPDHVSASFESDLHCVGRLSVSRVPGLGLSELDPLVVDDRFIAQLGVRALGILKAIHERGFIHGSIGKHSFAISDNDALSAQLVDFTYTSPWGPHASRVSNPTEPMIVKSLFELDGSPPSRLDDIYRLTEVLLGLTGQRRFQPAWYDESNIDVSTPGLAAAMKQGKMVDAIPMTPIAFFLIYEEVRAMRFDQTPLYDKWTQMLDRLSKVPV